MCRAGTEIPQPKLSAAVLPLTDAAEQLAVLSDLCGRCASASPSPTCA